MNANASGRCGTASLNFRRRKGSAPAATASGPDIACSPPQAFGASDPGWLKPGRSPASDDGGVGASWRLSWRTLGRRLDGAPFLFHGMDEARDPGGVRAAARRAAGEAYGGEFRLRAPDGAVVHTDLARLLGWDESGGGLPPAVSDSLWQAETTRLADIEAMAVALRRILDTAVGREVMSGTAAAALVRDAREAAASARGPGRVSPFSPDPPASDRV